ncbi:hypothetical protein ACMZOO_09150 [Catenovulum sp. SX2]|uniref:hypothetical protein n=1 Tax=Catenovulum sp. SX2 TaxID=3398614 RepID=UPI003F846D43
MKLSWSAFTSVAKTTRLSIALLLLFVVICGQVSANGFEERRALVGLKIFKTLVTADLNLLDKQNKQQQLVVLVVHNGSASKAESYSDKLAEIFQPLNGTQFKIQPLDINQLQTLQAEQYAGIFIAEPLADKQIELLVKYSVRHSLVVFSPFAGDVEKGILGGLSVQASVRPLLNKTTLDKSKLSLKAFYLKVAKLYE